MLTTPAYAAADSRSPLAPYTIERREPGAGEVLVDIRYCGVCHSDVHQARGEWGGNGIFPMVPGHEIVGHVARVGEGVTRFKVGDAVGVGCFVDSCRICAQCRAGEEQYCDEGMTGTYNARERAGGRAGQPERHPHGPVRRDDPLHSGHVRFDALPHLPPVVPGVDQRRVGEMAEPSTEVHPYSRVVRPCGRSVREQRHCAA